MTSPLRIENLTLTYHRHPVVHHASGEFAQGEATALVGPNGAGKSTLMKALVGLLKPNHGRVDFGQRTRRDIAYLPQQAAIDRSFPLSVADCVQLGHWHGSGWFGKVSHRARHQAEHALEAVGLAGFESRNVDELSAGQFQRVLFARILLQDAPVILLDEPFTALDSKTTADLLAVIDRWRQEGRTIIAVLHDFEQVRSHFAHTLLLAKEVIAWGATDSVLTPHNLARANAMAQAWDERAPVCHRDDPAPEAAPAVR
ncbi:zinc ABC transporter ATP-binding protein AztA [Parachitinimonas caeni]|uniref:Zinc ABC transporter ATP-binding protein AztA n=1 Tax=Parachitinimonas caeni TaxID=3031301 RepID=A0ABT7DU99_9NEIS|nr:zinc ABC transporter ATP-binding protein AztA [Parachitinimonas caeni]MDK2123646.1 zinc ABC transporter ATP-binding protein AztA [Parachitinimonas caeni]